jgi:hypothetical protein
MLRHKAQPHSALSNWTTRWKQLSQQTKAKLRHCVVHESRTFLDTRATPSGNCTLQAQLRYLYELNSPVLPRIVRDEHRKCNARLLRGKAASDAVCALQVPPQRRARRTAGIFVISSTTDSQN